MRVPSCETSSVWLLTAVTSGLLVSLLLNRQSRSVLAPALSVEHTEKCKLYEAHDPVHIQVAGVLSLPGNKMQAEQTADAYQRSVYAASSFAFQYSRQQEAVRLLIIGSRGHYLTNMDRFLYKVADAAIDHPSVNVSIWGPGWLGYNVSMSLSDNVRSQFGCSKMVTFAKLGAFTGGMRDGVDLLEQWAVYRPCGQEVLVEELADCHNLACMGHSNYSNSHVVASRFAFIPLELFYPMQGQPKLFTHIPDCAVPALAQPVPWVQKIANATLIGHTWDKLYPLRPKILEAVTEGLILGGVHYEHPGWNVSASDMVPPDSYVPHAAAISPLEQQFEAYYAAIRHSKICMFDSSIVHKSIAKYFEAMMSGCVVAADLPLEMQNVLSQAMVILDQQDSPAVIAAKVNAALADPTELLRKATAGISLAQQYFTCEHKLERILDAAGEYRAGQRGYVFPFGFRIGCHSYFPADHRPANAWCAVSPNA